MFWAKPQQQHRLEPAAWAGDSLPRLPAAAQGGVLPHCPRWLICARPLKRIRVLPELRLGRPALRQEARAAPYCHWKSAFPFLPGAARYASARPGAELRRLPQWLVRQLARRVDWTSLEVPGKYSG